MTRIEAGGRSENYYPAERATVTARVTATSTDRQQSIAQATKTHNWLMTRAAELRDGGAATWAEGTAIATHSWIGDAEGFIAKKVRHFQTSSEVRIKLADLALVSPLTTELADLGVTAEVSWSLTEKSRRERESVARREAVRVARQIASDYAAALGTEIFQVVSVTDQGWGGPAVRSARFATMADASAQPPAEVTIPDIEVNASVTAVFETAD